MAECLSQCGKNHIFCAKRVSMFEMLSDSEMKEVISLILQKRYMKDEIIIAEGSKNPNFIIINRGQVKVFCHTPEGKEQILYILSAGDFIGERSLVQFGDVPYSVQALENTLVCMITRNEFQQLLFKHPQISLKIMESLCKRLDKMEALAMKMSPKDADARINMMLLEFSRRYGVKTEEGIFLNLPLSREEMANYIGVTRETVCGKLACLKADGIIRIAGSRKLLIVNENALYTSA